MIWRFRGREEFAGIRPVLLGLLLAMAAMMVVCTSDEPEPTATPTPSVSPTEEASPLTLEDQLADIERKIEDLRGIDTPPPVTHKFVDQEGMGARLVEELSDPEILRQIDHEETLLKLLGIIPQDSDLNEIYDSMLGAQVLGLYDPEKEEFFVLADTNNESGLLDSEAHLTYAHEYVHRLQDAKFDLEAMEELAENDDMSLAIAALIEGDATTAQGHYMIANFDLWELSELLEASLEAQAELPEAPYFLQKSLEFPYSEGAAFIAIIHQMGQFAAVDAVFADPPESSEQVLHAEKYLDNELPVEIDIPDEILGEEWTIQAENVLGEFFIRTWLESLDSEFATAAAAGWGGDAYIVLENDSGESATAIVTTWDSDNDAHEFIAVVSDAFENHPDFSRQGSGLDEVLESWIGPGGEIVVSRWDPEEGNDRVAISIAPDAAIAHELNLGLVAE